jgi:hypothetical protein
MILTKPIWVESNHFSIKWAIRLSTDVKLALFTFPTITRADEFVATPHLFSKLLSPGNRTDEGSVKTI